MRDIVKRPQIFPNVIESFFGVMEDSEDLYVLADLFEENELLYYNIIRKYLIPKILYPLTEKACYNWNPETPCYYWNFYDREYIERMNSDSYLLKYNKEEFIKDNIVVLDFNVYKDLYPLIKFWIPEFINYTAISRNYEGSYNDFRLEFLTYGATIKGMLLFCSEDL